MLSSSSSAGTFLVQLATSYRRVKKNHHFDSQKGETEQTEYMH
jgi:hypothetical protein